MLQNILEICFKYFGAFAPLVLIAYSFFLLWNKHNLFFYYTIGVFMNSILNLILKGIIQEPRPIDDPKLFYLALKHGKHHIFKDYIPFNIFGMPSGHAQSSIFSTVFIYLSLGKINILVGYLIVSFITMIQRVVYKRHTILQVFVGAIVGGLFGYSVYYLAEQTAKGKIKEKPDDDAPI
jgi:membrane-associated phospholipid phosphatase